MGYIVEKDWITEVGLRAVCTIGLRTDGTKRNRCGYVGVPKEHPAFGKSYGEQLDFIAQDTVNSATIGDKSPMLLLTACVNSDGEDLVRRSLDILIDCHGGLTYSGNDNDYPVESDLWWFGFDCAHYEDLPIDPDPYYREHNGIVRSLEFVQENCESIAVQLKSLQGVIS